MFSTEDTIVAIATPPGRGGIGVVRLSGGGSLAIASALTRRDGFEPRSATLTAVYDKSGATIDRALVTHFPAPHSYTGDDVVEISAHGSPVVLHAIVQAALGNGARLARPGEFTLRAYLHGRIDLIQAEAVGDLIEAATPLQARVACDQLEGTLTERIRALDAALLDLIAPLEASLDFPDEGYHFVVRRDAEDALGHLKADVDALVADAGRGRLIRDGLTAVIVGRPNVGKSSLFNRLAGAPRAIVTDVAGTTRDLVTEAVDVEGIRVTLVDTAGLRDQTSDPIEEEGVRRSRGALDAAGVAIVALDSSQVLVEDDYQLIERTRAANRVLVATKTDLPAAWDYAAVGAIAASAVTNSGVGALRQAMIAAAGVDTLRDSAPVANLRQAELLGKVSVVLARAAGALTAAAPEECVLIDLHEARALFDEITGARPRDAVLQEIFARFCIGK